MADQALFKNQAFGGFNKEDVLAYIDSMNAKQTEEQEQSATEITSLTDKLTAEKEKREDSEKSFSELMTAYEELREHYLNLKERCDNLASENVTLKQSAEKAGKELSIEKELNRQLEDKMEAERQKADEHEASEKKTATEIAEMGDSAKAMLSGAKSGAQNLITGAQSSAESINSELDDFHAELEKTKTFMQDSLSVLIQRLEYIDRSAEGAKLPTEGRSDKMNEIQSRYEEMVAEVNGKVASLKNNFFH